MKNLKREKLTYEKAHDLLDYNHQTGILKWKEKILCNGRIDLCSNKIAGSLTKDGYVKITINGRKYLAHRIAWLLFYGCFPKYSIDHKDRIKHHNWIDNLRDIGQGGNMQNQTIRTDNSSGITGVSWHNASNKWQAHIKINKKRIYLGLFKSKIDAAKARYFGELKYFTCTIESSAEKYIKILKRYEIEE